ncbi:hypothetical protein SDC9_161601 [bioreactor metagenome]|uniref:Uncharacterized protein n=1 Tax=bioreactor metagenome TaxID=1076179 RepID=A0A645FIN1_9ZZZZ
MHPIFGFVKDDGLRSLEHPIGHFHLAAAKLLPHLPADFRLVVVIGGQAVHKFYVCRRFVDQVHAYLVAWHKGFTPFRDLSFLTHPPPQVSVDKISIFDRINGVFGNAHTAAGDFAVFAGNV